MFAPPYTTKGGIKKTNKSGDSGLYPDLGRSIPRLMGRHPLIKSPDLFFFLLRPLYPTICALEQGIELLMWHNKSTCALFMQEKNGQTLNL